MAGLGGAKQTLAHEGSQEVLHSVNKHFVLEF